jgi:hypothetical protein
MNLLGNYSFGLPLMAIAIIHFIRRRPDAYWLWIIMMGGGLGALVYICVEVLPDLGLLRDQFRIFSHRKRIRQLEVLILDNPSAGNYEELADLYLEQKNYLKAKDCYDRAISTRTDSPDPFYRRALCEINLNDFTNAAADLERVLQKDRNYDYQRAAGLMAHAWSQIGKTEQADRMFQQITETSTLSETQYNYACFLAAQGKPAEAKGWAQKVLAKKITMPRYLKRRERPWFRKAAALLKKLPQAKTPSPTQSQIQQA